MQTKNGSSFVVVLWNLLWQCVIYCILTVKWVWKIMILTVSVKCCMTVSVLSVSFRHLLRIQEAGADIRPRAWPPKWPTAPFANTAIRFTLHHLWELAIEARTAHSVVPQALAHGHLCVLFRGQNCSAQPALYSFPSRHSAPSQNWQFNDFTSFLWNSQCTAGNDRLEVQQERYIIEGLTGPGWVFFPPLATAVLAGRSLSFSAQETEF